MTDYRLIWQLCDGLLEHLGGPIDLFRQFVKAASKVKALIFIHVPMVNESLWPKLFEPDKDIANFNAPDVHVSHMTWKGLSGWTRFHPGLSARYLETTGLGRVLYEFA